MTGPIARLCLILLAACQPLSTAWADTVAVAVASNFAATLDKLGEPFHKATGHTLQASSGSTGQLYAQIGHGAPFQVFLSADTVAPARLIAEGQGVPGSQFTYAIGQIVLWSARPGWVDGDGKVLEQGRFSHLALANPKTAPYGAAAVEVLRQLGLHERLSARWVQGENIAQAHQFVATGNAELGFVARSQVYRDGKLTGGSAWDVPQRLYPPIRQDALLLKAGQDQPAAHQFLQFLKSEEARTVIRSFGYAVE